MNLKTYNTLTKRLEDNLPKDGKTYKMYFCGPTVYGPAHIGNFRTFVLQDVLRRVLNVAGVETLQVRNITDIDDKTIRQSQAENKTLKDFTTFWTEFFHKDCEKLNMLKPDVEPKATEHIDEQIALIDTLLKKGYAYISNDGSIYFSVSKFENYGKLANIDEDALQSQNVNSAGENNLSDEYDRENIRDFAIWKATKPSDGDNHWQSPWGNGRPGWHLECSAMSMKYLGEQFDLHGGGIDLCFPHHTNEIAQSEAATGVSPCVFHWLHSAHLMVEGEKMSKSLGNLFTLSDLEKKGYPPSVVRYALISGHYKQQLNFTFNGLLAAKSALKKLSKSVIGLLDILSISKEEFKPNFNLQPNGIFLKAWENLLNDLNVPACLGEIFANLKKLNSLTAQEQKENLDYLCLLLYALGINIFYEQNEEIAKNQNCQNEIPQNIQALASERWEAKKAKDFAKSDLIRNKLLDLGWNILDKKDGFDLQKL